MYREEASSPVHWLQAASEIEQWIDEIRARGGRVALVRLPTSDYHWSIPEAYCPKAQCWDALAEATSATTLHFRDVPELQDFKLPDGSHIDRRDTVRFTRILIRALETKGLFRPMERAGR